MILFLISSLQLAGFGLLAGRNDNQPDNGRQIGNHCHQIRLEVQGSQRNGSGIGSTKTKLGNSEVRKIASTVVGEGLRQWLDENPAEAKAIIEKIAMARKARNAARAAREKVRKTA